MQSPRRLYPQERRSRRQPQALAAAVFFRSATRRAPLALCAADLDADGFTDVAVAHFEGDVPAGATSAEFRVTVLHGSPDGLASRRDDVVVGSFPRAITSADFDGDGFTDLAVACSGDGTVYAVPGGPLGVVLPAHVSRAGRSPRALTSADFDGDGFFDLAVADVESSRIHLLRGGKEGLALEGDASRVSSGPASIGSGDFDGDGFLDVATASTSWNTVSVLSQRFLVPHATAVIAPEDGALGLDDPRSPPSYRLELAPGAFAETSRVSVLPATVFPPGPNETTGRATYLRVETYAARILREGAKPRSTARLTLLLRRELPPEDFALLEVYRKHPSTGRRVLDEPATRALEPHELSGRPAVRFPIAEFGTYLVAAVRTRE